VSSIKPNARVTLALGGSLESVLLGYLLIGHFLMVTLLLVRWAALVLVLGASGFALAGRDPRSRSPAVVSGISARFALGGLVGGVIDLLLIAILLIVGWSRH
jgi:hypothetical protein